MIFLARWCSCGDRQWPEAGSSFPKGHSCPVSSCPAALWGEEGAEGSSPPPRVNTVPLLLRAAVTPLPTATGTCLPLVVPDAGPRPPDRRSSAGPSTPAGAAAFLSCSGALSPPPPRLQLNED